MGSNGQFLTSGFITLLYYVIHKDTADLQRDNELLLYWRKIFSLLSRRTIGDSAAAVWASIEKVHR
jgi:hypothetical protein